MACKDCDALREERDALRGEADHSACQLVEMRLRERLERARGALREVCEWGAHPDREARDLIDVALAALSDPAPEPQGVAIRCHHLPSEERGVLACPACTKQDAIRLTWEAAAQVAREWAVNEHDASKRSKAPPVQKYAAGVLMNLYDALRARAKGGA